MGFAPNIMVSMQAIGSRFAQLRTLIPTKEEIQESFASLDPIKRTVLAIIIFIFPLLLVYPFLVNEYWIHIGIVCFYYLVAAVSWNMLFGYTGLFSFAHAAMGSFGAYSAAFFILNFGVPHIPAIFLGACAAGLMSYLLGKLTLRLSSIFLAFITLAFAEGFRLVITLEYRYTGGLNGLRVPYFFGSPIAFPYYFLFLAVAAISLIIFYFVIHSKIGLYLRSIKEDEMAASVLGVNTTKWKIFSFTFSGFFMGLIGAFLGTYLGILDPTVITWTEMGVIMSMVIIGGAGTFLGPLIGVPLIELLSELLRDLGDYRLLMYGLLMIIFMRVSKGGIIGTLKKYLQPESLSSEPQLSPEESMESNL